MRFKTQKDIEFMSDTSAAVLTGISLPAHIILWVAAAFILAVILWTNFAELDEITRAEGKVIPSSEVQVIQNLEGGIIEEIVVSEGEIVNKGQVLIIIDDTQFSSNLRESQIRTLTLRVKISRLTAEANNKPFVVADKLVKTVPQMVVDEQQLYQSRQDELRVKLEIIANEIIEKKQEMAEIKRRQEQLKVSHELVARELALTQPLMKEGAVSKVELLRLERTVNDLKGELEANELAIPKIESGVANAKKRIEEMHINFRIDTMMQLNEAKAELKALFESNLALADRVARTAIRSPVRGIVNQINMNTIGGIIQPGERVMEIVPVDDSLLIEAEIKPADIGFIRPDLDAMIKLTAYDYSIYGGLKAKVVQISPDTVLNEKKESTYLIKLRTDKNFLEKDGKKLPIIAGMRAAVDILTGKKTVLDYLLKPILKTKQRAFTER